MSRPESDSANQPNETQQARTSHESRVTDFLTGLPGYLFTPPGDHEKGPLGHFAADLKKLLRQEPDSRT